MSRTTLFRMGVVTLRFGFPMALLGACSALTGTEQGQEKAIDKPAVSKMADVGTALDLSGSETSFDGLSALGAGFAAQNAVAFVSTGPGPGQILGLFRGGGTLRFEGGPSVRATLVRSPNPVMLSEETWCPSDKTCWLRSQTIILRSTEKGEIAFDFASLGSVEDRGALEKGEVVALEEARIAFRVGAHIVWLSDAKDHWAVDAKPVEPEADNPSGPSLAEAPGAIVSLRGSELFVSTATRARRYVESGTSYSPAKGELMLSARGVPGSEKMASARSVVWDAGAKAPGQSFILMRSGSILMRKGHSLVVVADTAAVPGAAVVPGAAMVPGAAVVPSPAVTAQPGAASDWDKVKAIAKENCTFCHTASGKIWSDPLVKSSWQGKWKAPLLGYLTSTTDPMPPLGTPWAESLTAEQRALLVKFTNEGGGVLP